MVKTNGFTLLTLFVRLMALVYLVDATLKTIPLAMNHFRADKTLLQQDIYYYLFVLGFFVLLWLFADVLAKFALARKDAELFESSMQPAQWAKLLFAGLGVWHVSVALMDIAYFFGFLFSLKEILEYDPGWYQKIFLPGVASCVVQLVVGLSLFFGSAGLTRLFQQYRHYGVSSRIEDTVDTTDRDSP